MGKFQLKTKMKGSAATVSRAIVKPLSKDFVTAARLTKPLNFKTVSLIRSSNLQPQTCIQF